MTVLAGLRRDIDGALVRCGMVPRHVVLISPLGERKGVRFAYRVTLEDGRTVKARHFGSEAAARRALELQAGLEEAFACAVAQDGPVLVEQWIEGIPLNDIEAAARADEAGGLLGRLHSTPLGACAASVVATGPWRQAAESDLALLGGATDLGARDVEMLRAEIARRDPGSAPAVLIHKDFCVENMLVDRHGRLRIIDNEQLEIAPAGFDLGRTFHRWPMADATWTRFLRGVSSVRALASRRRSDSGRSWHPWRPPESFSNGSRPVWTPPSSCSAASRKATI